MRFQLTFLFAIVSCLPAAAAKLDVSQLKPDEVKQGTAVVSDGPDFLFAFESAKKPALFVDSEPVGSIPGKLAITMALPLPQLPQSVHDVSIDNTLSSPISTNHSWTYPGLACGALIRPQFAQRLHDIAQQAPLVLNVPLGNRLSLGQTVLK